ncbi:MAG TPA: nuclear transport factor 2 family protein [Nevskiaceae bacterium]|nr:nuclear transport factor 2 family protein [Nevskiaceae bacterium]
MHKQRSALLAVPVLLLAACSQPPPPAPAAPPAPPKPDLKAEEATLRQADKDLVAAIAAKNIDAVLGFYASDAVMMAPNEAAQSGDALKKGWTDLMALPEVALDFSATSIGIDPDAEMAYDVGTYTFGMASPKGKVDDHGNYVEVWRKTGGKWKIVVDAHSSSVPLPQEAAPAAAKK